MSTINVPGFEAARLRGLMTGGFAGPSMAAALGTYALGGEAAVLAVPPPSLSCDGAPSQADFYAFLISAALPGEQMGGNPSQCVQGFQYAIDGNKYYIFDTNVDGVLQHDPKYLVLWRDPAGLVGTTVTVPIRPLHVGDGTAPTGLTVGWTQAIVSYSSSGSPESSGYGPHPMTYANHALIAQTLVLPATLNDVKALTWNSLSQQPVDAFQRQQASTLGTNWTVITGLDSPQIDVNQWVTPTTLGTAAGALWTAATFTELDQFAWVRLKNFTGGSGVTKYLDLVLRGVAGDASGYRARVSWTSGGAGYEVTLYRDATVLSTASIGAVGNLERLEFAVTQASVGSDAVLTVIRRGLEGGAGNPETVTTLATYTDTTPLTQVGSPGMRLFVNTGGALSNLQVETWQGGHLYGPSPSTEVDRQTYVAGNVADLLSLDWAIPWGAANGVVLFVGDHANPSPALQAYPSGGSFAQWVTRTGQIEVA